MSTFEKVLGSIAGAAIGDAMGAVTELRPTSLIIERFGGYVNRLIEPPDDTFARGSKAGSVTDDFSLTYYTAKAIIENNGVVTKAVAEQALLNWSEDERYFNKYAGPTTRAAIEALRGKKTNNPYDFIVCDNAKASNGSAMKISPAGIFNPGNLDQAIDDAICISMPTHNNNLSISGACAIAAAVSEAMTDNANVYSIVQAGLYGANQGLIRSSGIAKILAGPSVVKRIHLAVDIALKANNLDEAMEDIAGYVGTGLPIYEAVPAVFGLIVAAKGDAMKTIIAGVNAGSDTDTVASMSGAIVGALHGSRVFPQVMLSTIESVNGFDLTDLAKGIDSILNKDRYVMGGQGEWQ